MQLAKDHDNNYYHGSINDLRITEPDSSGRQHDGVATSSSTAKAVTLATASLAWQWIELAWRKAHLQDVIAQWIMQICYRY
mmetsp:Transcript_15726/g.27575  ORF Transcript_15726/g.27575 Transcript_15726/m.27575 type:complete len:81 (-) Transcript_15726:93-335(-)